MTSNERIYKNGMNKGEIQTIAAYIKKKLKKKADVEKLAALRGDEAIKFYEKYYAKATEADTEDGKTAPVEKKAKTTQAPAEKKAAKQVNIAQTIGNIDKTTMKTGVKAAEVYGKQLEKLGKMDRLVLARLNVAAGLGLDFDTALKIANNDELYSQLSAKIWG